MQTRSFTSTLLLNATRNWEIVAVQDFYTPDSNLQHA